ncbi:hypothetical protein DPMN_106296 [Dreissena polymorpha]|uniref:Uncharacterized protein n=1 Tax=Dreissena polymorpha TaxID=45954 RepID=A0A9D4QJL1_DREPO|nr:hypothetical protein DPMN_106296 [Dreissena polymorpha]
MAWKRPTRLVIGPCIYQFEVNWCRNEEFNFQGSSANSVGEDSGQDGWTDGQTADITTIYPCFTKSLAQTNRPTNQLTGQKQYVPHYNCAGILVLLDSLTFILTGHEGEFSRSCLKRRHKLYYQWFYPGNRLNNIIGTNLLTMFHEDRKINVASRVKNAPPLGGHVIQANVTIFKLIQDIIKTNLLNKFHQNWTINVASRVLTRKNAPPPHGGDVFQPTGIIFELVQDIIWMNLLTKFHYDWTNNVAFRVKNAQPLGSHVFQAKVTIFELIKDISGTNLLSKLHEDRKINVASRVLTRFYYSHFHEDWPINVANIVSTRQLPPPPPGGHVFQRTITIFKLTGAIVRTKVLIKFHKDWIINVTS